MGHGVTPLAGPARGLRGPGEKLQNVAPCVCDRAEGQKGRRAEGQKARKSGGLNLEALLEPCRLFLLGGSRNTSKKAINKDFDIC